MTSTLRIFLNESQVGIITRLPDDRSIFTFEESYLADENRPTLSQSFFDSEGQLFTQSRPVRQKLPVWFSNLLPEGPLRHYLAQLGGISPEREFYLLALLGSDLPGAVRAEPEQDDWIQENGDKGSEFGTSTPLRFSLAGVQLKFSALLNQKGGLTIPASGLGGDWIVKLPSATYPAVPENEFVMLRLAQATGINVPEHRLVPLNAIENLPDLGAMSGQNALAVRRFDRGGATRIHIEDFAQAFGIFPEDKYGKVGLAKIAETLANVINQETAQEFIARLAFTVLTGNGDMHLKNWSLIYPDGKSPILAPAYDLVSTVPYLPNDRFALNFAGTKDFAKIDQERFLSLARKAFLSERATLQTLQKTVDTVQSQWPRIREEAPVPEDIIGRIDAFLVSSPLIVS